MNIVSTNIKKLQLWMETEDGLTYMNYAYSFGAAIVILGTLFKLTHLPGSNLFLFLGMGTEVVVFMISAFDRPFKVDAVSKQPIAANHVVAEDSKILEDICAENLNEMLHEVRKAYSLQLESISKGTLSFEELDSQAVSLAEKMKELNLIYSRMIDAVKVKE